MNNLNKYKKDLEELVERGMVLHDAMQYECRPVALKKNVARKIKK